MSSAEVKHTAMNIIRISTGSNEARTQSLVEFLSERHPISRFRFDRFEIERKEIDGHLDDLVIAIATNLRSNAAIKFERAMQAEANIFVWLMTVGTKRAANPSPALPDLNTEKLGVRVMVTFMEANGQLYEGKTVVCYGCGEEHESFDPYIPEGGFELCDDCAEEDD